MRVLWYFLPIFTNLPRMYPVFKVMFFIYIDYKDFIQKADFEKWMSYDKKFHDNDNSNEKDLSEKETTFELLYKALSIIAFILFFYYYTYWCNLNLIKNFCRLVVD